MVELHDSLITEKKGLPKVPDPVPSAVETFQSLEYGVDSEALWAEADIISVCRYLRGGKHLRIPEEFRPHIPVVL